MQASVAVAALLALVALAACLDEPVEEVAPEAVPPVRFLALGDMGTGGDDQKQVAAAMAEVCRTRGCDFVIGLGDLIYPAGASSPDDPQFETKFEEPYAGLDLPFWMVLGNHDNGDASGAVPPIGGLGLWYQAGNNEVAYAQRTDRTSDKWHMPARHYTFASGIADFIGLDTNTLLFYGVAVPPDLAAAIQEQESWLPAAVREGDGPWKVAFGHHPYVSNGEHGDAGEYDGNPIPGQSGDHLKAIFEQHLCDEVDLYVAGHDHHLQWLEPVPSCGRTMFLVSGGGGASLYELPGDGPRVFQQESLGFFWVELTPDALHAAAFDQTARLLFEATVPKPLTRST